VKRYAPHQRQAFLEAFNAAHDSGKYDESTLFKIAHTAAKKAKKPAAPRRIAFRKFTP
jgi:hypothetical protein